MTQRYFYGWNIVGAAIVIGFMTTGLGGYANGIILPHLADELADGSRGTISLAFSLGTILVAVFSPFVGRHADRNSPRNVMLLGASLLSLTYLVLASATTIWQLILAKSVLYGAAMSMVGPMVRNMTVAHWFTKLRGRALGFSVMGASIAGVLLPLILSNLVTNLGWRTTVYGFAGGVALILIPLIWRVVKDKPAELGLIPDGAVANTTEDEDQASVTADKDSEVWSWKELLRAKPLWATGLTFGPMICVYLVIMVHLFGHAKESGLTDNEAALTLSVLAFASIFFKPVIGFMADAIGARITLWAALFAQATAMILFASADSMASFAITAVIFGFGYAALSSMRTFALAQAFGMKSLGSANGLLSWIELPFAALASPIAGFVFDATGSYDGAFFVFAGFLMLGCLGPLMLPKNITTR